MCSSFFINQSLHLHIAHINLNNLKTAAREEDLLRASTAAWRSAAWFSFTHDEIPRGHEPQGKRRVSGCLVPSKIVVYEFEDRSAMCVVDSVLFMLSIVAA